MVTYQAHQLTQPTHEESPEAAGVQWETVSRGKVSHQYGTLGGVPTVAVANLDSPKPRGVMEGGKDAPSPSEGSHTTFVTWGGGGGLVGAGASRL